MSKLAAIAEVAVPLPVDRLFDYSIPQKLIGTVAPGMRVRVIFNRRKMLGYVIGLSSRVPTRKLNPIIDTVDQSPLISPIHMKLAKKMRDYYISSYGEIIDGMLPAAIKRSKGMKVSFLKKDTHSLKQKTSLLYVQNMSDEPLLDFYKNKIAERIQRKESILFVVPEVRMIKTLYDSFDKINGIRIGTWHGQIAKKEMIALWHALARKEIDVLIGTRSSIFAPLLKVGLIVIYDENDHSHKEDRAPYYHSVTIARFRSEIEGCDVIMSSVIPSAQTYLFIKNKVVDTIVLSDRNELAEIGFTGINFQDKIDIMLEREIAFALEKKEKIFIFHNRKGFATFVFCKRCKKALTCDRCNSNLHYDFTGKQLFCPSCNYKTAMKEICPFCNASYVKFEGLGIEKLASNLKRIFPSANIIAAKSILSLEKEAHHYDIIISTSKILHLSNFKPDVSVIWNTDSLLNTGNYNAAENTYQLLSSILRHTKRKLVICTGLQRNFYVYEALNKINFHNFYESELKARRELRLPPFFHFGLISMRGFDKKAVEKASRELYDSFKNKTRKGVHILDPSDSLRSRLRGKYYRYALVKSKNISTLNQTIRTLIKKNRGSRIIITADIDPV